MGRRAVLIVAAVVAAAVVGSLVIFGWHTGAPPSRPEPSPPEVGIKTVQAADVPLPLEYAGRVVGFREVEIRSLVGGLLLKRGFDEGAHVSQGQLLFQIDPAPYEVALTRAQAQLSQAQATLKLAEDNYTRAQELFGRGVSTERQRDEAQSARDQARAAVQLAEAEIANAKLDLSHTEINAPVSGVTAVQSPSIGTLIQAQQTVLTTISPLDPAYVSFSFTDEEAQAFQDLNAKRSKPIDQKDLVLRLEYGTGKIYPHAGKVDTAARRVDPQTGTIEARGVFPNPDGSLLPGQFVRVQIGGITLPDAILVPKAAVSQGPQGPYVYVVGPNDIAEPRPIRLGPELEADWVVQDGLKSGDRVVVDGVIRVRPGAPVKPAAIVSPPEAKAGGARP